MIVHITYDNILAKIDDQLTPELINELNVCLRYRPDGYEHVYSYKSGNWDGYNYLFNTRDLTFRRGLLDKVTAYLELKGHEIRLKYVGNEHIPVQHKYRNSLIRPYDFQKGVIDALDSSPMGIIVSPTGTGKTVMISIMINALATKTMILVTDVVLLDQMVQAMEKYFDQPIGIIGDGEFRLEDITVSTVQSIRSIVQAKAVAAADKRKALEKHLYDVGAVISDEAHLYDSDGIAVIMPIFARTQRFYGMSATPYGWADKAEKKQNLELEQHFGTVIYDTRKENFIELGLKVPVLVNVIHREPLNKEYKRHQKKSRGKVEIDWGKNYRECLETELLKNTQYHGDVAAEVWKLACAGKSAFVHAAHSIEFGEEICKMIPGAVLVNGSTPRLRRREVYDAMRKKELLTLVSDVGGTGLDIPSLDAMVLASDIKDVRQLLGRVARRPHGGTKEQGLVLDFNTQTQFLAKHHKIRCTQYENEGYPILG